MYVTYLSIHLFKLSIYLYIYLFIPPIYLSTWSEESASPSRTLSAKDSSLLNNNHLKKILYKNKLYDTMNL